MELRHLRYFVCVAEELNFTRAAERLGMSQPPLSAQIRQLEEDVGTPLLRRLTRGVELTEAGKSFLDEARLILDHVEQAKADVERRARGEMGRLRVGFAGGTALVPLVATINLEFTRRYQNVTLAPEQSNSGALVGRLQSGEVDVAFVRPPLADTSGLAFEPVADEEMFAVLPCNHPLANSPSLPLAALALETFILPPRSTAPGFYDYVIAEFSAAGFAPILGPQSSQLLYGVPMVGAGFGITLVPASIRAIDFHNVVYVALTGRPLRALLEIAYRRGERAPAIRNFIAVARQTVRAAHAAETAALAVGAER